MELTNKISDELACEIAQVAAGFYCDGTTVVDRISGICVALCGSYSQTEVDITEHDSETVIISYSTIHGRQKVNDQSKICKLLSGICKANFSEPKEEEDWYTIKNPSV